MQPVRGIEGTRPPAGGKKEPSGLFFSVRVPSCRNVYRGCCLCALRKGVFNLTHTGIAVELTAASEQRLPPVGGRCRIATKRGVQGSEAGAVVSGMRTPLQGVKHTLGTTTRDRAAVRSRVSNQPSGLLLSASGCGSQHPRVPWAARLFAHCFLCRAHSSGGG